MFNVSINNGTSWKVIATTAHPYSKLMEIVNYLHTVNAYKGNQVAVFTADTNEEIYYATI